MNRNVGPTTKERARGDKRIVFTGFVFGRDYRTLQQNAYCYVHATEVGGTHPALLEAMCLRDRYDYSSLRIFVLGALNWTIEWFRLDSKDAVLKLARRTELLIFDGIKKL